MTLWRSLGPVLPATPPRDILRSALGTGLGLLCADLILWALSGGTTPVETRLLLIAPFGATAFLIFVVPNSPLAQPWSAVIGNTVSALVALAVLQIGLPVVPAAALAVLLAVAAMALTRALHPPGGAVAIATVLAAPNLSFALQPVFAGTAALVVFGMVWNRATGRHYPFRLPNPAPTAAANAAQRLTPGPFALAAALDRLRMGANLGVEDLSRLIAAAEGMQALGPLTAASIMSRDLVTVDPATQPTDLVQIFRLHDYRHLPLVQDGHYLGLIPQSALLGQMPEPPLARLVDPAIRPVPPETLLAEVLTRLSQGGQTCIPVTEAGTLLGLITRTDLLVALTHGPQTHGTVPR